MLENNRLQTITTPMYSDASTTTLDQFINHAKRQFTDRVIALYEIANCDRETDFADKNTQLEYEALQQKIKESLYSTDFYDMFWYAGKRTANELKFPVYHFRVNPKNINFETTLTSLREEFRDELGVDEVCMNPKPPIRIIRDIPQWEELFGKGEFPFMSIFVFRLGNTEYFSYDIHR